jgi:cell division septal protein FtsQ
MHTLRKDSEEIRMNTALKALWLTLALVGSVVGFIYVSTTYLWVFPAVLGIGAFLTIYSIIYVMLMGDERT